LQEYFKSKNAKLDETINPTDINEQVNDLIKNLDCLYSSDCSESGLNLKWKLDSVRLELTRLIFVDLEMVLNSLISLIIISSDEKIAKFVTTFCESIVGAQLVDKFGLVKLRV
jgi:hypothetical protein